MSHAMSLWFRDLRVRHTFLVVGRFRGTAGVHIEAEGAAAFHYCLHGSCVVLPDGQAPVELEEGEFLFMQKGLQRQVFSGALPRRRRARALRELVPSVQRDTAMCFTIGAGSTEHVVLGGAFCLDNPEARPFLAALPPVLRVRRGAPYMARLRTVFLELVDEAQSGAAGAGPVVARLSEVAVLIGLRAFVSADDHGCPLV